ncbi:MAG: hypothetical protein ABR964_16025 [Tepidisphaeraceae bacterium]
MPELWNNTTGDVKVTRFAPGEIVPPTDYQPGDFILTHGNGFFSKLIRFGQAIRFRGKNRKFAWWNHAALIVAEDGSLIEALGAGVRNTNISKYAPTEYHLVHLNPSLADRHDREQMVHFARDCLGRKYGWAIIISISLSLLTGCKFSFGFDGEFICSGLVARALERTSVIFLREPSHMMPADLAKYFNIEAPKPGTSRGQIPPAPRFWKQAGED